MASCCGPKRAAVATPGLPSDGPIIGIRPLSDSAGAGSIKRFGKKLFRFFFFYFNEIPSYCEFCSFGYGGAAPSFPETTKSIAQAMAHGADHPHMQT